MGCDMYDVGYGRCKVVDDGSRSSLFFSLSVLSILCRYFSAWYGERGEYYDVGSRLVLDIWG